MTSFGFTMRQDSPHFAAYYRWLVLAQYLKIEAGNPRGAVLDVGCDDGYLLARQEGCLKCGVDLHPRIRSEQGISVVQADGCMLPFADTCFSVVLALDVLEHVQDDQSFLNSVTRVLAPGGCLWLSTPSAKWRLFPGFLMGRAMRSWGHQRPGYEPSDLIERFPGEHDIWLMMWSSPVFRNCYVLLRLLWGLSPSAARLGARLCFVADRELQGRGDHIFLRVMRRTSANAPSGSAV
jgi:SAM-dependent methyltransferase